MFSTEPFTADACMHACHQAYAVAVACQYASAGQAAQAAADDDHVSLRACAAAGTLLGCAGCWPLQGGCAQHHAGLVPEPCPAPGTWQGAGQQWQHCVRHVLLCEALGCAAVAVPPLVQGWNAGMLISSSAARQLEMSVLKLAWCSVLRHRGTGGLQQAQHACTSCAPTARRTAV